jgi:hypothetical protein
VNITLTRVSPTVYAYERQGGDLSAVLVKSSDGGRYGQGTWMWSVEVCGDAVDTGSSSFRDARAQVIAVLETIAPAFVE